jgi:hypothetical protein
MKSQQTSENLKFFLIYFKYSFKGKSLIFLYTQPSTTLVLSIAFPFIIHISNSLIIKYKLSQKKKKMHIRQVYPPNTLVNGGTNCWKPKGTHFLCLWVFIIHISLTLNSYIFIYYFLDDGIKEILLAWLQDCNITMKYTTTS